MARRKSERVWMYLRPEEIEFLDDVMRLTGIRSRGEAARFLLRLTRLIMPRADVVIRVVSSILQEGSEPLNPQAPLRDR